MVWVCGCVVCDVCARDVMNSNHHSHDFMPIDHVTGGAERLVVDAALSLQNRGYNVQIYTSHHDLQHCFVETKDGWLSIEC